MIKEQEKNETATMNTRISYLYRDADNYKVHNEVVVAGTFRESQIDNIIAGITCGEYFLPCAVGLPEVKFEEYDSDLDGPWFELGKYSFEETSAPPTVDISAEILYLRFMALYGYWDHLLEESEEMLLAKKLTEYAKGEDEHHNRYIAEDLRKAAAMLEDNEKSRVLLLAALHEMQGGQKA